MQMSFTLDGESVTVEVDGETLLIDLVRSLGKTGPKEGCGVGVCGLCTMLVDGLPVSSCLYLALCAVGREVYTIEGIAQRDPRLIEAFVEHEGMQCGICTPGQVVSAYALKQDQPDASLDEIRAYMAGNLCRCTGYQTILSAVEAYLA